MASTDISPIIIGSDDDESDSDDVVVIKEEIEVDSDDVIFLSETKPTKPTDAETGETTETNAGTEEQSRGTLFRNNSVTSAFNDQLSLSDPTAQCDIRDLQTSVMAPLDLSSKVVTGDTDQSLDTALMSFTSNAGPLQGATLNPALFPQNMFSDSTDSFQQLQAGGQMVSAGSKPADFLTPTVPSDYQLLQAGDQRTVDDSKPTDFLTHVTPTTSATSVSMPPGSDIVTPSFSQSVSNLIPSFNQSDTKDQGSILSTSGVGSFTLDQSGTMSSTDNTTICLDAACVDATGSSGSGSNIGPICTSGINNVLTGDQVLFSCVPNTALPQTSESVIRDMNSVSALMISSPGTAPTVSTARLASRGSAFDPFTSSHLLLRSLDPLWSSGPQAGSTQSPRSGSGSGSGPTLLGGVSGIQSGTPCSNSVVGAASPGLPGGSAVSLTLPQPSSVKLKSLTQTSIPSGVSPMSSDDQDMACTGFLAVSSKQSMSVPDLGKLQSSQYITSTAGQSTYSRHSITQLSPLCSSSSTYQLPPKKQKRCFSQEGEGVSSLLDSLFSVPFCANCGLQLAGDKFSRCPNGHASCAKCLEEKVKLVLTGKAKESVRCLNSSCDSFYPISELKHSLPSMVVEILEDKLDLDNVDCILDMILKNAAGQTAVQVTAPVPAPAVASTSDPLSYSAESVLRSVLKQSSLDADLPETWEPMDEHGGYRMIDLDPKSDEFNEVMLRFYESMTDPSVDVVKIHRVQNPIMWKFYKVKRLQMLQDNGGFLGAINELKLFHGTRSSVVEAICKSGFDWRVCGKNGTLYGQGSYFAVNASYSHQYTDFKDKRNKHPQSLIFSNSPSFFQQHFMAPPIMSSQLTVYSPVAGPTALNLSQNTPTTAAPFSSTPSSSSSSVFQSGVQIVPSQSSVPGSSTSGSGSMIQKYRVLPKPLNIRSAIGMPSSLGAVSGLGSASVLSPVASDPMQTEGLKHTCKLFLARVLVGKYVAGNSRLRKPPPLNAKTDPFGKCYDSCVDDIQTPKIYVIFDSAQAYPEYLIEYTYD